MATERSKKFWKWRIFSLDSTPLHYTRNHHSYGAPHYVLHQHSYNVYHQNMHYQQYENQFIQNVKKPSLSKTLTYVNWSNCM